MITDQSKRHRNLHKNSAAIVHIAANAGAELLRHCRRRRSAVAEGAAGVNGEQSVGGA